MNEWTIVIYQYLLILIFLATCITKDIIWEGTSRNCSLQGHQIMQYTIPNRLITVQLQSLMTESLERVLAITAKA